MKPSSWRRRMALDDLEPLVVLEGRKVVGLDVGELDFSRAQRRDGGRRILKIAVDHPVQRRLSYAIIVVGSNSTYWSVTYWLNLNGPVPIGASPTRCCSPALRRHGGQRMLGQDHHLGHRSSMPASGASFTTAVCSSGVSTAEIALNRAARPIRSRILGKSPVNLTSLDVNGLPSCHFAGELESVGPLVWHSPVGVRQDANHLLQLLVIVDQRLKIDAEPGKSAGRRKRVEIALETSRSDVKPAESVAACAGPVERPAAPPAQRISPAPRLLFSVSWFPPIG